MCWKFEKARLKSEPVDLEYGAFPCEAAHARTMGDATSYPIRSMGASNECYANGEATLALP